MSTQSRFSTLIFLALLNITSNLRPTKQCYGYPYANSPTASQTKTYAFFHHCCAIGTFQLYFCIIYLTHISPFALLTYTCEVFFRSYYFKCIFSYVPLHRPIHASAEIRCRLFSSHKVSSSTIWTTRE